MAARKKARKPPRCKIIPYARTPGVCDLCGTELTGKQQRWCSQKCSNAYQAQHYWSMARARAKMRDKWTCTVKGCGEKTSLEVNHITPRNGKGYGWGCWHHVDGLETLCHAHHLMVTAQQRAAREARRK